MVKFSPPLAQCPHQWYNFSTPMYRLSLPDKIFYNGTIFPTNDIIFPYQTQFPPPMVQSPTSDIILPTNGTIFPHQRQNFSPLLVDIKYSSLRMSMTSCP